MYGYFVYMESFFTENFFIFRILWVTWWLWLPPVLFYASWELWKAYLKIRYWKTLEWVLLEIKIPREIAKSPKAMEQIFAGLHGIQYELDFEEKYWQGLQYDYFALEMMSHEGEIHFFIRAPKKYRNLVESVVYAQYPDSEIREADDPTTYLPYPIPNKEWTIFGSEFKLAKPNPYPIRTYEEFIVADVKEEEKVDPVSAMAELLAKLKTGEHACIQLMIRPATDYTHPWREEGEKIVAKLIGKKDKYAPSVLEKLAAGAGAILSSGAAEEGYDGPETLLLHLTPGERDVVKGIERKTAKIGFDAVYRFVYIARREVYSGVNFSTMMGALRQFNTQDLNSFKINSDALVSADWWKPWKKRLKEHQRKAFNYYYRARQPFSDIAILKSKTIVLNVEELATIYHFPGVTAAAPLMPRLHSRKAEPPAGLPVK